MTTTSSASSSRAGDGGWLASEPRSTPSSARDAATAGSGSTAAGLAETARTRPLAVGQQGRGDQAAGVVGDPEEDHRPGGRATGQPFAAQGRRPPWRQPPSSWPLPPTRSRSFPPPPSDVGMYLEDATTGSQVPSYPCRCRQLGDTATSEVVQPSMAPWWSMRRIRVDERRARLCATTSRPRPGRVWSRRPATWSACTPPTGDRLPGRPGPDARPPGRAVEAALYETRPWSGSWACAGPCSSSRSSSCRWSGRLHRRDRRPAAAAAGDHGRQGQAGRRPGRLGRGGGEGRRHGAGGPRRGDRHRDAAYDPVTWPSRSWSPRASRTRAARAWSTASCCCWPPRAASSGPSPRVLDQRPVPLVGGRRLAAGRCARWSLRAPRPSWSIAAGRVRAGHVADVRWWTGLPMGQVRKAVAAAGAVEVDLDGVPGLVLPDDLDPVPAPEPWVALLRLDPTTMGWAGRDFLGPHRPVLFDRNGNAGPAIWWDGRVVGGWAQRRQRRGRPAPPRGRRRRRHRRHRGRGGPHHLARPGPGHPRLPPGTRAGRRAGGVTGAQNSTSAVFTTPAVRPGPEWYRQ